ncbi:DUF6177 family protein [Streptomyces sp. NPDC052496]|uniref:DUF6177 family protein n=1 Tax=Streptomyces sp. NPDC052496 TaxID=3154951 RepID=UPI0034443D77
MPQDVISLTPNMPDVHTLLAGLYAGGPDSRLTSTAEGAAVQLHSSDGRPLVTVEAPVLVQVPGEAARLLGAHVGVDAPVWWTEVRATTAAEEAGRLAGSIGGRLIAALGGITWPPGAAHTDVVAVSPEGGGGYDGPYPAEVGDPLSIDVLTDQSVVVLQDRPVVAATTWLTDALRTATASGRELQLITPPSVRLTLPTRTLLDGLPARWVVRAPAGGYYDGLSGVVLHWREGRFAPAETGHSSPQLADAFTTQPALDDGEGGRQLLLSMRTTHPADEHLLLGGALEAAWQALTGAPPAGWATAEPVSLPWSRRQLTELARARAQKSIATWLVAVGALDHPAIATTRIAHTPAGVEEHITLAVGYPADQTPPLETMPELAETLATRHNLTSMLTHLRCARRDLTIPPHREASPPPLSFTLGPDAVHSIGRTTAESAPAVRPVPLGRAVRPALHYSFGDGADPTAWQRLKQLTDHLNGA